MKGTNEAPRVVRDLAAGLMELLAACRRLLAIRSADFLSQTAFEFRVDQGVIMPLQRGIGRPRWHL